MIIKNNNNNNKKEIKDNNSSNANEVSVPGVKLTQNYIDDIHTFQVEMQAFLLELGDVEYKLNALKIYKQQLLNERKKELDEKERTIADSIYSEYGEGEINPTNWTFTSSK